MRTLDLDLLRPWERIWELPEVWSALCRGEHEMPAEQIARALVRRAAHPATSDDVFEELLALGESEAAAALLSVPMFQLKIADSGALLDRLAAAQAERLRAFDQRAAVLQLRAAGLGLPSAQILADLERGRAACSRRWAEANEVLCAIDEMLGLQEAEMVAPTLTAPALLAPQAPLWPFQDPPAECCRWFLAAAGLVDDHVPAGFIDRWAVQDEHSLALATAMLPLLSNRFDAIAVGTFTGELERFLGCTPVGKTSTVSVDPVVIEQEDVFLTVLRGLPTFGLPGLSAALLPGGIPLVVTRGQRARVESPPSLGILFCANLVPTPDWALRLEPRHLFPLMRHSQHRALQVLRALASQIRPANLLLPTPPSADMVFGRDRELQLLREAAGVSVLVGAKGMGKTSLLLRHVQDLGGAEVDIEDDLEHHPDPSGRLRAIIAQGKRCVISCTPADWQDASRSLDNPLLVIPLGPLPLEAFRAYLQGVFDLMDVRIAQPQVLDRLLWCSGGHPGLLGSILRTIWTHQAGRSMRMRFPLTDEDVERAWSSPGFRERATELLIKPLAKRPVLLHVLYRLLELSDGPVGPEGEIDEVTFVELFEKEVGPAESLAALDILEGTGLITRNHGSLAPSNLGTLINYLVVNPEQLLRQILEDSSDGNTLAP